jgi:predicted O-methyltransferase YrrM
MPSFYKNIYGYFDFENLYGAVAEHFPNGRFVEIGTWLGKSTCFMAETIKEKKLSVKFFGVDNFLGEINATDQQEIVQKEGGCIYKRFLMNMKEAGVLDYVTPLKMTSKEAAELFDNGSLDFVFLDAEHLFQDVLDDLSYWWPKVKVGGILAGHDWNGVGVNKAVRDFSQTTNLAIRTDGICFILMKEDAKV